MQIMERKAAQPEQDKSLRRDVYSIVTEQIISELEKAPFPGSSPGGIY